MKKYLLSLCMVLALFACKDEKKEANVKPLIKIGASLPLTGDVAFMGNVAKEALLMNFEKWQTKDTKYHYQLVIEDDSFEPKKIATAGNKLINYDHVNAIISFLDQPAYYYFNQASTKHFIHMTCSWGDDLSDETYNFNNITSHSEAAKKLVDYMKKIGVKRVGYVSQNNTGPLHLKNNMLREFEEAGIELVFEETFNIGNKDFRMFLASIKDKPVDVIMTVLMVPDMYAFAKQKNEMGITTPLTTVDYFEDAEHKEIFNDYYYVTASMGKDDFRQAILSRTGSDVKACVANTADNLDLLIWAYENAPHNKGKIPTAEEVSATLHSIKDRDGSVGKIDVMKNGHIESRAYLKKIINGNPTFIEE
ncbi:MAG: ABC transporter substrate-binding protein [Alphaproteobacteria bacterium]|nr:ABC transporter substrate-binding protein [Alphaproteobacteria bacterium]